MATLEDRILGEGKRDNYCSSSEDEADDASKDAPSMPMPPVTPGRKGQSTNTGPKGVLKDWEDWKEHERQLRADNERQLVNICKRTALTCVAESDQPKPDDMDLDGLLSDEDLREFVQKRMGAMHQSHNAVLPNCGSLAELSAGDEFLKEIDESSPTLTIIVHIYEKGTECNRMNECLAELCKDYPSVKFCGILASKLGMTPQFKSQGVPAILVYKAGGLIGNFVGLKEEFGSEFYAGDVENYLIENGILEDKNNIPKLLLKK